MLTVKTYLQPSPINSIGLFAAERIPKGTITWKFDPRFDISFDPDDVAQMSSEHQELIKHFAYLSKESGKYIFSLDDTRFTNHSTNNNIDPVPLIPGETETQAIANRDIEIGEELTVNYRLIDAHDATSSEAYLA